MDFLLLGPLEVRGSDQPIDLGGTRQRALLAALLVRPGEVVAADRLVDELWGGDALADPANTLQAAVSRLRRGLGAQAPSIAARPPGYVIEPADGQIDIQRFERSVARGRSLLAGGDLEAAALTLGEALAMWRGPVLSDLADLPFVAPLAARLGELRLSATEERAEADLALGRHAEVTGELEALVDEHPYRERLRAQLMLALARSGRQAEALATYHLARVMLRDELGIEPGSDLQRCYDRILRQEDPVPVPSGLPPNDPAGGEPPVRSAGNLPTPLTRFVGREREVAQLLDMARGVRLVTLTGPGGAGKTRLAVEVAAQLREETSGGTWFIDLASVTDPGMLATAVAVGLGLRDDQRAGGVSSANAGRWVPDHLVVSLREREALLVLDNCEHLIGPAAHVVRELLAAGPQVRIVCTSRETLGIPGEAVLSVPPLATPSDAHADADPVAVADFDAVQLFMDRARDADPSFRLDGSTAPAVAEICRRLDGIPLALELAAARLRAFDVRDLAARLDDRFALLVGGDRTGQPRQRTLRNLVEWSWDLLDEDERIVLRRLSVLPGRWDLELAVAVCGDGQVDPADVPAIIASLVDRSLVVRVPHGSTSGFRILETIRAFAAEHRDTAGEDHATRARHAQYLAEAAWTLARGIRSPTQLEALRATDDLYGDFQVGLDWAMGDGNPVLAARIAAQLGLYGQLRGRTAEAERWTDRIIDAGGQGPDHGLTVLWNAAITVLNRPLEQLVEQVRAAWVDLSRSDDDFDKAQGANLVSLVEFHAANLPEARRMLEISRRHAAAASAHHVLGYADYLEGTVLAKEGSSDEAERLVTRALHTAVEWGDVWGQETYLGVLSIWARDRGHYDRALALADRARPLAEQLDMDDRIVLLELRHSSIHILTGDLAVAEPAIDQARVRAGELGVVSLIALADNLGGVIACRDGRLADARTRFERALAIQEALGLGPRRSATLASIAMATLTGLGTVAELLGDGAAALRFHHRSLDLARAYTDPQGLATALEGLAGASACLGDGEQAARLLGAAATRRERARRPLPDAERIDVDRTTSTATRLIGAQLFATAFATGSGCDLDNLIGPSSPAM